MVSEGAPEAIGELPAGVKKREGWKKAAKVRMKTEGEERTQRKRRKEVEKKRENKNYSIEKIEGKNMERNADEKEEGRKKYLQGNSRRQRKRSKRKRKYRKTKKQRRWP